MSTALSATPVPARGFSAFELREELERAIAAVEYTEPRPIQMRTIPAVLQGHDVMGLAQTGTGKTAAFALPILDRLLREPGPGPRVLIVAPTRELATQIDTEVRSLARFTPLRTATVYGGVSDHGQRRLLKRRPEIVVACPGRLLDLHRQGVLRLDRIETLVLDEADHMFDMGFLPDLRRILAALPADRQNLLFSATMPREIRALAAETLRDPVVVELAHGRPAETIEHALYPVVEKRKRELLERLIRDDQVVSALVFTRTKHRARKLARDLERGGHRAVALQGNMSQNARDRAMAGFRSGEFEILVATDIVARGIDVEQVSHVFNFDMPSTPDAYTHRIGRTGRAERRGRAYTFVTADDCGIVQALERRLDDTIPRCHVEGFERVTLPARGARPGRGSGSRGLPARNTGGRASRPTHGARGRRGEARRAPQSSRTEAADGGRGRGEQNASARDGEGTTRRRRRRPVGSAGRRRPGSSDSAGSSGPSGPSRRTRSARADGGRGQRRSATGAAAPRGDSSGRPGARASRGATADAPSRPKSDGRRARRRRRGKRREASKSVEG